MTGRGRAHISAGGLLLTCDLMEVAFGAVSVVQ